MDSDARKSPNLIAILPGSASYIHMRIGLKTEAASIWSVLLTSVSLLAAEGPKEAPNQLTADESAGGWKLLFDGKTPAGWRSFKKPTFPAKGWGIENGWLASLGEHGGDIISTDQYEQFELKWEWKLAPKGNSGVKYFVLESRNSAIGHEYQMLDDSADSEDTRAGGKHITASFYDVLAPAVTPPTKPIGEINQSRIIVRRDHVEHWLNGVKVLEYECGSEAVKEAVAKSKFKNTPGFGNQVKGHILLQDHGSRVWFRNLKIRDLSKA